MAGANVHRRIVLQERDKRLLEELSILRVIDREQASVVGPFHSKTRANARLNALTAVGLLRRAYLGTIVGGRRAVYCRSDAPVHIKRIAGARGYTPALGLMHQLAVNDVYLAATYDSDSSANAEHWTLFDTLIDRSVAIIPDGYFEVAPSANERIGIFLEVDRGTESLGTWTTKVRRYLTLAVTGLFEAHFRLQRFRVATVALSEQRLAGLQRTVAKETDKLFWFTTLTTIKREGFWSPIWMRPSGNERQSLI